MYTFVIDTQENAVIQGSFTIILIVKDQLVFFSTTDPHLLS